MRYPSSTYYWLLYNVQALINTFFKVTCQIEYVIVELFIYDPQKLSLC